MKPHQITEKKNTQNEKRAKESASHSGKLPKEAQASIVYAVVFLAFMGQMLLNPIIAPLSREMGLLEWHIGATISLSAIMVAALSPFWGKTSQKIGVRKTLVITMSLAFVALALFAFVAMEGMSGLKVGVGVVAGVMLTRGLLYGLAISGVMPAAQTHLVTHTKEESQRVKAVGGLGAMNGLSSVVGAIAGGSLAAFGGLLVPLVVMPLLILAGIIVLLASFKPGSQYTRIEKPKGISYFDSRVFPFLVTGLIFFIAFSSLVTLFGFIIQDRFNFDAQTTAGYTALFMVLLSVIMIITQAVLAPKSNLNSIQLMRVGLIITILGFALIIPGKSLVLMGFASVVLGLGSGLLMPGYNAGPTLNLSSEEQGSLAGLINSNNGIAYAIAPLASTALYGIEPVAPLAVALVFLMLVTVFTFIHPTLKNSSKR